MELLTVRSCRSNKSRRTKVLLHFMHLKGRSFVSIEFQSVNESKRLLSSSMRSTGGGGRDDSRSRAKRKKSRGEGRMIHQPQGMECGNIRDLSCLLRCSLLLKARLQNWHLYFFSGAIDDDDDFLMAVADAAVGVMTATGIVAGVYQRVCC